MYTKYTKHIFLGWTCFRNETKKGERKKKDYCDSDNVN